MRKVMLTILVLAVALTAGSAARADGVDAQVALDKLKSLAGTWTGAARGEGGEAEAEAEKKGSVVHEIQVSAAGTVVMETMNPGTEHEMINMYHLDGEELVLTHYCAGGNQPTMRLNRQGSSESKLVFDFTGGTNLDPAVDPHIHSAVITLEDGGRVVSSWDSWNAGKPYATMVFELARGE